MSNTNTILVIASSTDSLTLTDGREEHIGYYLNELVVPVQVALDAGYRMTVFSNDEEHYAEEHYLNGGKVSFYVNDALKIAGGDVSISDKGIFQPFLVEDRELITGQNPPTDHQMAERFVKALDRATSKVARDRNRTPQSAAFV